MTDEELLVEKKKQTSAKIFYASFIGFLAGILIFGIVASSLSPEKQLGFLIPWLFLVPAFTKWSKIKKEHGFRRRPERTKLEWKKDSYFTESPGLKKNKQP